MNGEATLQRERESERERERERVFVRRFMDIFRVNVRLEKI